MGLFDRFTKPKWQHKDSKVRRSSIAKIDDMDILIELSYDSNEDVSRAALNRICNLNKDYQNVFADIIEKSSSNTSKRLARNVGLVETMDYSDRRRIEYIIRNFSFDKENLLDLAINSDSTIVKETVLNYNNMDKDSLIQIAKNSQPCSIAIIAVKEIARQYPRDSFFIDLAKGDLTDNNGCLRKWVIRSNYILDLKNQEDLYYILDKEIKKEGKYGPIYKTVLLNRNFHDEEILYDYVINHSREIHGSREYYMNSACIRKINDEKLLSQIKDNAQERRVRDMVEEKLNDDDYKEYNDKQIRKLVESRFKKIQ